MVPKARGRALKTQRGKVQKPPISNGRGLAATKKVLKNARANKSQRVAAAGGEPGPSGTNEHQRLAYAVRLAQRKADAKKKTERVAIERAEQEAADLTSRMKRTRRLRV